MTVSRRLFQRLMAGSAVLAAAVPGAAQALWPHEPLDPSKAQSLATSPLAIESAGKLNRFTVEVANTKHEHDVGLMHRTTLAADHGMLFDFHEEEITSFWMRNTFIPLDMLFIRATGEIVMIAENTVPHSEEPIGPRVPVLAVLEVPGGTASRLGIKVGDIVHHAIFKNMADRGS